MKRHSSETREMAGRARGRAVITLGAAGLILTALLLSAAPASAGADTVRFRYALRPGAAYEQRVSTAFTVQVQMDGLAGEQAEMAQAMMKDLKQEMVMTTTLQVGPKEQDGSVSFETKVSDASVKMTMAGQPIDVPGLADKLKGMTIRARRTADGKIEELQSGGAEALSGLPQQIRRSLATAMPEFPDREMRVGDSFEVPVEVALPGMPMAAGADLKSTAVYTLRSLGEAAAVFDVRQTMHVGAGGAVGETAAITVSGTGTGTASFDRAEGIFTSSHVDFHMEMTMEMPSPPGLDAAAGAGAAGADDGAASPPMKLKAVMQGPADITMKRTSQSSPS
jgi:hypothetical protein